MSESERDGAHPRCGRHRHRWMAGRLGQRIIRGILICAAGVLLVPGTVTSQEVRELTVEESVRLGLERNPRVRAADADAAEGEAAYREARGVRLPSVRSQAGYTRLGGDIPEAEFTFPGLDTTFTLLPIELDRYQAEITLEQPIFTGGRLRNQVRAA